MDSVKLVSEIIEAVPGVKRAYHVFTPALTYRLKNRDSNLPVAALRSSLHGYTKMKLYQRIEALGPSSLDPLFDNPLPGTNGRGVMIQFTEFPLRVWYAEGQPPTVIDTPEGRSPDDILDEVLKRYEVLTF